MFKMSLDMKKLIAGISLLIPVQLMAAEDSVYSWGTWAQGIMPAAGNIASAAPAPAQKPNVNFRPNEAAGFGRTAVAATPAAAVNPPAAPPAVPGAPQLPNVVIVPSETTTTSRNQF